MALRTLAFGPAICKWPKVESKVIRAAAKEAKSRCLLPVLSMVSFEASSFTRVAHCDDPGFEYNLDHFTGTASGDRFRAVNNDGGHEVDTPYVFERIACH